MASPAKPVNAFIGLGSNLGDRAANIESAVALLGATPGVAVVRVSRNLENPAVGGPPESPPFFNAVAQVQTTLGSHALLERLLEIERPLGRPRRAVKPQPAMPAGDLRSTPIERRLRWIVKPAVGTLVGPSSFRSTASARSTRITSAPMSASIIAQKGPGPSEAISTTLSPRSGPCSCGLLM